MRIMVISILVLTDKFDLWSFFVLTLFLQHTHTHTHTHTRAHVYVLNLSSFNVEMLVLLYWNKDALCEH